MPRTRRTIGPMRRITERHDRLWGNRYNTPRRYTAVLKLECGHYTDRPAAKAGQPGDKARCERCWKEELAEQMLGQTDLHRVG